MRRRRSGVVLQHANIIRVVILGKKGVGKSGTSNFSLPILILVVSPTSSGKVVRCSLHQHSAMFVFVMRNDSSN